MPERLSIALLVFATFAFPTLAFAAVAITNNNLIEEAVVLQAKETNSQTLTVSVVEGPYAKTTATFVNDGPELHVGDRIYLSRVQNVDGSISYAIYDYYRLPVVYLLSALFLFLILYTGGIQGLRGLLSLCGGLFFIFFLLLPGILSGLSPILIGLSVAFFIVVIGSYVTHGFSKTTSAAVIGMLVTVLVTGVLAFVATNAAHLGGGFAQGNLFVPGYGGGTSYLIEILFTSIIIGLLGVLYDVAIGQAVVVEELFAASPRAESSWVYQRALRVGREHIGALVNMLALAYVGVSLPLFLSLDVPVAAFGITFVANSSQIATELVRILVSGIGLMLAVPITTFVAVRLLHGKP